MTVVENLQRQDLNCMEQATAFSKLSQEFKLTQEQIGQRVGISRESVSNYMRLLRLPASVTEYLQEGRLGFSEARVLLTLLDPNMIPKIADEAVRKHMSVEQLEDLVFNTNVPLQKEKQPGTARWVDPNVRQCRPSWSELWECGCGFGIARAKGRLRSSMRAWRISIAWWGC